MTVKTNVMQVRKRPHKSRRILRHYIGKWASSVPNGHKSQDKRHGVRKRASFVTKVHESQDERHES